MDLHERKPARVLATALAVAGGCAAVAVATSEVAPHAEAARGAAAGAGLAAPSKAARRFQRPRRAARRGTLARRRAATRRVLANRPGIPRPGARFALDGPRGMVIRRNLHFGPPGASLDLYRRAGNPSPSPAVLVVHGGGWTGGGKQRMRSMSMALARNGFVAFNLGYELATPGYAGFPRQPQQLRAAIRWIRRNALALDVDPLRIGAFGSSAGAHLAALVATQADGPLSTGDRVAAVVGWSAPLDLPPLAGHMLLGHAARTLVGCTLVSCPERWADASPLAHVSPGDPPMMLVNSLREMVPVDQSERMADRLSSAGVPHELVLLPGHGHGRDYATDVVDPSLAFLRRWLSH